MLLAQIIVWALLLYLLIGVLFGVYFVTFKISGFDESAKGTGLGFKLIILFGTIAFWPVIALRMARGGSVPSETNAHRRAAEKQS